MFGDWKKTAHEVILGRFMDGRKGTSIVDLANETQFNVTVAAQLMGYLLGKGTIKSRLGIDRLVRAEHVCSHQYVPVIEEG